MYFTYNFFYSNNVPSEGISNIRTSLKPLNLKDVSKIF